MLVALLLMAGCANPMTPQGGPVDRQPPAVVASEPAAGAVNVDARTLRIEFTEYVNAQSFPRAFSISPNVEGRLEYGWRGRAVEVIFPEALRENTTYVVTLDNNLRDANGVALDQPITLAFSTGPEINRGRLAGQVLDPLVGSGVAGMDVYAYARPDSSAPAALPERPDYRTQTGSDGRFAFQYLSRQPYFVVAVQDRNRNRKPDPGEAVAVPPAPAFAADTTLSDALSRWFVTALDTVPPQVQRARALSSRRLEVRFNEAVSLRARDTSAWVLQDSIRGLSARIRSVYALAEAPTLVYALTDSLQAGGYQLRVAGVADSAGNVVRPQFTSVSVSAQPDTVGLRFLGFVPDSLLQPVDVPALRPGDSVGVRFNLPVSPERLAALVSLEDSSGAIIPYGTSTPDGTTYRLAPATLPGEGAPLRLQISGSALNGVDTSYERTFRYLTARELGELSGYVAVPDGTAAVVELYASGQDEPVAVQRVPAAPAGRFLFSGQPEGRYRLRAFADPNGNGRWDPGRITPYEPAEPLVWSSDSLRIRPRWEYELPDTLRIPSR